jgi:hypothetical protein
MNPAAEETRGTAAGTHASAAVALTTIDDDAASACIGAHARAINRDADVVRRRERGLQHAKRLRRDCIQTRLMTLIIGQFFDQPWNRHERFRIRSRACAAEEESRMHSPRRNSRLPTTHEGHIGTDAMQLDVAVHCMRRSGASLHRTTGCHTGC